MSGSRAYLLPPLFAGRARNSSRISRSGDLGSCGRKNLAHAQYRVAMRDVAETADRGRAAKQIALHLVAKFVLQELKLGVGLDTFRQHGQPEPASKAQHRTDNGRGLIVGVDG